MPVRETAPLGAPIWIDLTTSDLDAAQEFYGAVFGWTFDPTVPNTTAISTPCAMAGRSPG